MLKRKNDRQPPQRLEEERYPNDYWLDEEDGGEDISEPADSVDYQINCYKNI